MFEIWFCGAWDTIIAFSEGYLRSKLKAFAASHFRLMLESACARSCLDIWNQYGRWVHFPVGLFRLMPDVFHCLCYTYHEMGVSEKASGGIRVTLPPNVYANMEVSLRVFFYLSVTASDLIQIDFGPYQTYFQMRSNPASYKNKEGEPDDHDCDYTGLTRLGLERILLLEPKFKFKLDFMADKEDFMVNVLQPESNLAGPLDQWTESLSLKDSFEFLFFRKYKSKLFLGSVTHFASVNWHFKKIHNFSDTIWKTNQSQWIGTFLTPKIREDAKYYDTIVSDPEEGLPKTILQFRKAREKYIGLTDRTVAFLDSHPDKAFTERNESHAIHLKTLAPNYDDSLHYWEKSPHEERVKRKITPKSKSVARIMSPPVVSYLKSLPTSKDHENTLATSVGEVATSYVVLECLRHLQTNAHESFPAVDLFFHSEERIKQKIEAILEVEDFINFKCYLGTSLLQGQLTTYQYRIPPHHFEEEFGQLLRLLQAHARKLKDEETVGASLKEESLEQVTPGGIKEGRPHSMFTETPPTGSTHGRPGNQDEQSTLDTVKLDYSQPEHDLDEQDVDEAEDEDWDGLEDEEGNDVEVEEEDEANDEGKISGDDQKQGSHADGQHEIHSHTSKVSPVL
jgi:hypothetical protein